MKSNPVSMATLAPRHNKSWSARCKSAPVSLNHYFLPSPLSAGPTLIHEPFPVNSHNLTSSLQRLSASSAGLPTMIPPEIIAYIEDGRNPDIYTREFVELVQKSNMYLKGKSDAFGAFRDILAEEIVAEGVGSRVEVQKILQSRVDDSNLVNGNEQKQEEKE